jgi:2-polyprenyl-3-methyl-5-hydroxy-6-metoxy-1,4-benzoquinol methylase
VLDYGCGTGDLLAYCQPREYVGYDVDPESLVVARSRHREASFVSELPDVPAKGDRFDVIVMAAVVEHLENPALVLAHLGGMLAASGRIVLTTPHPHWRWIHDLGARIGLFSREASEEHKTFVDRSGLSEWADSAGLDVQRAERFLLGANQLFVLGRVQRVSGDNQT